MLLSLKNIIFMDFSSFKGKKQIKTDAIKLLLVTLQL